DFLGQNSRWTITLASDLPGGIYQCIAVSDDASAGDSVFIAASRTTDSSSVLFDQAEHMASESARSGTKLPQILTGPRNFTAYADSSSIFLCKTANADKIVWLKDNVTVSEHKRFSIIGSGSLKIERITNDDQGRYTCMASNMFGSVSRSAWLKVEVPEGRLRNVGDFGQRSNADRSDYESWTDDTRPSVTQSAKMYLKHRHVPFDAPQVFQVSNTSIQYKKLKSGEDWQTVDINLPHYSASHVVDHLVPGNYYRFRVAVIYDNYLQSTSKASVKFTLDKTTSVKPPSAAPIALKAVSKWPDAIKIEWQYPSEEMTNIDGFVIRFRRIYSGAGVAYENETIPGATTREHMLDHLLPATPYEIKVVAYNAAGQTRSSNTVVTNTLSK
ncbi:unnamed protein product, partial [Soboliphyme baturini]|uniref:Fibronectin type-III domain-containing protein n=1 Tax=Soboliphyme baturini TaxID=241478 RepID=A0A183J6A1_9BILA